MVTVDNGSNQDFWKEDESLFILKGGGGEEFNCNAKSPSFLGKSLC